MNVNKQKKSVPKTKAKPGKDVGVQLRSHHFVLGNHSNKRIKHNKFYNNLNQTLYRFKLHISISKRFSKEKWKSIQ